MTGTTATKNADLRDRRFFDLETYNLASCFTPQPFMLPLSLYLHFPWCVRKCPYCDFNSHALTGGLPEDEYVDALLFDLEGALAETGGRAVSSIFMGGGTPSLFSPGAIGRLLVGIDQRLPLATDAEITLEANPGTLTAGKFAGFASAGVNRLSLGIQSFDDAALKALGRIHDRAQALAAIDAAQRRFANFNLDLMFGLPGQTKAAALADLDTALSFAPPHLSCYQLTIEENTAFFNRPPELPESDEIAAFGEAIAARLQQAGFVHYEISAFARPGHACRHNLNYWRFGDYLGLGAGAHGKLTQQGQIRRHARIANPRQYLTAVNQGRMPIAQTTEIPARDAAFEYLMNALRLTEGFTPADFEARSGASLADWQPKLEAAQAKGFLTLTPERIQPTAQGRRFLNQLLLDLS
jgi:oxygen-independent coproporphyrinogen-3 oxidase